MKLIYNISEVQNYVPVDANFDWSLLAPYYEQVEDAVILPLIGQDTLADILEGTSGDQKKVKDLLARAVANIALSRALPAISVHVGNAGVTTQHLDNTKQAEWWQVKDLRRSLLNAGYESIDLALALMETSDDFADWRDTDNYTVFKELLISYAEEFDKWFSINKSRLTFLRLRPHIRTAERKYVEPLLGKPTLDLLKTFGNANAVKDLMQGALVNYTLAEIAKVPTFELTPSGLFYKWEELPGEKHKVLTAGDLERMVTERKMAGDELARTALQLIVANPNVFPDYVAKEFSGTDRIITNNSGLAL